MATAELKTKATLLNVDDFLESITDENKKNDSKKLDKIMQQVTGEKAVMWGTSIIGYGNEHLVYESGRELDWMKIGFSPRKQNLTLYVLRGGEENYKDLLDQMGLHSCGKGCLYIKRLSDVNVEVLKELIKRSLTL